MNQRRVLFIAPTRIGDAVLASSILGHIRKSDPNAAVTIITSCLSAPLYEGFPQLARIICFNKQSYNRHWINAWWNTIGTNWDEIWDLRNSILSVALRAKHVHSFIRPKECAAAKVRQYEAGLRTGPLPCPTLWPLEKHRAEAAQLLPADARYFIFAPMANWLPKEWPLEYYTSLAKELLDGRYKGYRPVIVCAANERERALPLLAALAPYNPVDLTDGTVHLLTLYAVMQRAQGFFGNDSGLMHMASAAGTPTIGLFGPTPNIGDDAPHVRFLYAAEGDLKKLKPATVIESFAQLAAA